MIKSLGDNLSMISAMLGDVDNQTTLDSPSIPYRQSRKRLIDLYQSVRKTIQHTLPLAVTRPSNPQELIETMTDDQYQSMMARRLDYESWLEWERVASYVRSLARNTYLANCPEDRRTIPFHLDTHKTTVILKSWTVKHRKVQGGIKGHSMFRKHHADIHIPDSWQVSFWTDTDTSVDPQSTPIPKTLKVSKTVPVVEGDVEPTIYEPIILSPSAIAKLTANSPSVKDGPVWFEYYGGVAKYVSTIAHNNRMCPPSNGTRSILPKSRVSFAVNPAMLERKRSKRELTTLNELADVESAMSACIDSVDSEIRQMCGIQDFSSFEPIETRGYGVVSQQDDKQDWTMVASSGSQKGGAMKAKLYHTAHPNSQTSVLTRKELAKLTILRRTARVEAKSVTL